ncbi:MAG: NAD(P)H-dependent oxidoreductase [Anaeroplasmataceae bacterium]|nr:NAD(P)H-dependent oxidoreductase [Anaeroplasmataceae bacterium]
MKITVINGTEKHGVTYKLKEAFLNQFRNHFEITEYYLPKDCPSFCIGCTSCFMNGENTCKDFSYIHKIEASLLEADLIVMTSPAYVMHATGAMKAMLDHFGYLWMPHRPAPQMFGKRAVIITQCLGAGAKQAAKDIKHSLSWWGISKIDSFSAALMSDILWDKLSLKKRNQLTKKISKLAHKYAKINYRKPAHTNCVTKIKFKFCRFIQKKVYKSDKAGLDCKYWQKHGWLGKKRPWKHYKKENI